MKRTPAFLVLPLLVAASLSGCSDDAQQDTTDHSPQTEVSSSASASTPTEASSASDSTAPATTSASPSTTATTDSEEYEDLNPELFNLGGAYVVGGSEESGLLGCMVQPAVDYPFNCQINFTYPIPPVEKDGVAPEGMSPNVASMGDDDDRFITVFSPGSQGYFEPPLPLEPGQRVTIDGAEITHLHDGGFRVTYRGDAFEVHEGVYARDGEIDAALAAAAQPVARGTKCGQTYVPSGQDVAVVAVEDGTTCGIAMRVFRGYVSALMAGEPEGQAAFWTAPNGWGCFARWFFPDEEYVGANGKLACSAQDPSGVPAQEGSGEVVGLSLEDRNRL